MGNGAPQWATGDCFRCARTGVPTTRVSDLKTPAGRSYEIRACETCARALEAARARRSRGGRHGVDGADPGPQARVFAVDGASEP